MKRIFIFVLITIALNGIVLSQSNGLYKYNGRYISLKEDGTWKYIDSVPVMMLCPDFVKVTVDKFTGDTTLSLITTVNLESESKSSSVNIGIAYFQDKKTVVFSSTIHGLGATIREGGLLILLHSDGTKTTLENLNSWSSGSDFLYIWGGQHTSPSSLKSICSKPITAIRFETHSLPVDFDLTSQESQNLGVIFNCISEPLLRGY